MWPCNDNLSRWFARANYYNSHQNTGTVLSDNTQNNVNITTGTKWAVGYKEDLDVNLFFLQQDFRTDNTDLVTPGNRSAAFLFNLYQTPVYCQRACHRAELRYIPKER
jgi:hypothetical protein